MRILIAVSAMVVGSFCASTQAEFVRIGKYEFDPATLAVRADGIELSSAGAATGVVASGEAAWDMFDKKLKCEARQDGDTLELKFSGSAGAEVTFPIVTGTAAQQAWALPIWEGKYVPSDDADFLDRLTGDPEELVGWSLPAMGVEYAEQMATYLFPDPTNTTVKFTETGRRLGAEFRHQFSKLSPGKPYIVRLSIAKKTSLLEPALRWREWVRSRGELVTLNEKAAKLPEVRKLAGAAHVYLWGTDTFSRYDVRNWKAFAAELLKSPAKSVGADILAAMDKEPRAALTKIAIGEFADAYATGLVASAISSELSTSEKATRFAEAFKSQLLPRDDWGDGVSAKFVRTLKDAGLDRLWLGSDGPGALKRHGGMVAAAKEAGYLVGPYDSYHSIHPRSEKDTWETAQFPPDLIPDPAALAIQGADGKFKRGFKQKGFKLSPTAARSAVEARISRDMAEMSGVNSVFIDCDAFGEVYDDYSPAHPASQADDIAERCRRMRWLSEQYAAVIGSEGGVWYAAGTIHFAHGMTTPGIGWGDKDMSERSSPYFLGAYFPPDGPAVFTKQVQLKPMYQKLEFDPRYRLPLFEAAYHDCVVSTHHWSSASLKFKDEVGMQALVEMLYQLPPLWHLNHREWKTHRDEILQRYKAFSNLHRKTWHLPLTAFTYENAARTLQRTTFGEGASQIEVTANFNSEAENDIPPRSLRWREGTAPWRTYTP